MGFAEIKENAKGLSEKERRELVAFLVHLEQSTDPDYLDRITRKIDETEKFVWWDDVKGEFNEDLWGSFELLVHLEALETLRKIRGENRKQIRRFLSILPTNLYLQPDTTFEDRKGRIVSKVRIRNYILEYIIDDPVREIILQIRFICLYHLAIVK
ncbi:MAG: hypothetical protein O3C43_11080 [Verrucomicrobia bacterium]|nr:hypothetical protein [Verrucomicrobiota bacterium]MDA1067037.1 hypothetical protein [Verrucomicrobiota bacterium]